MKRVVAVLVLSFAGSLMAVEPPYFTDVINGYYLPDLIARDKAELTPGTLANCKQTSSSPTYNAFECQIQGCGFAITNAAGKTIAFPFDKLYVTEYQYDPNEPSVLMYQFSGNSLEVMPDGSQWDSPASLYFERHGIQPDRLRGRFQLMGFGQIGGAFIAQLR